MTLSIEEEILISAGLLDESFDPEYELDEGEEPPTAEEKKELLEMAREEFAHVKGRISKIQWEGGQPWEVGKDKPGETNFVIRMIFGSMRDGLPVQYVLGDLRIYCEPKQSLPGDSFKCVTINRASPASSHEPLTRESYVEEIAAEIRHQLREACDKCKRPVEHDDEVCGNCGAELVEDDDETQEMPAETPHAPPS